ncbi:MAG: hypothetical protein WAJ92_09450 [Candidatus Acidiferrales bacterium]
MRCWRLAVAGLFCLALASLSSAQMGMHGGPPTLQGVFRPVVGQGAQYNVTSSDGKIRSMEIAVVGKESVGGVDAYWFEVALAGDERMPGEMVIKSLTAVQSGDTTVSRMILQMAGRPPMEMPAQMLERNPHKQSADIRQSAEDVGSETVTVPAGTFQCEHYKMKDGSGDTWISEKVSPWGMVKYQGKESSMVLTKSITDAQDKITGTPVPFNPMGMAGPPRQ